MCSIFYNIYYFNRYRQHSRFHCHFYNIYAFFIQNTNSIPITDFYYVYSANQKIMFIPQGRVFITCSFYNIFMLRFSRNFVAHFHKKLM